MSCDGLARYMNRAACKLLAKDIAVRGIETALEDVFTFFSQRGRKATKVEFDIPHYFSKDGVPMPQAITLPNDEQVVLSPMKFSDAVGAIHSPPTDGVLTSDHPEFATASLDSTGQIPTIVSVADGVANITYTSPSNSALVSDPLVVTVAEPVPTNVAFDTTGAVFGPKS